MGEVRALSRIGDGLTSCLQIPELQQLQQLRSLCLHGNNITCIEGLQHLSSLQDLNLSSNRITAVSGLAGLTALTSLNLASNKLVHLQGLDHLPNLTHLNLSYNTLTSLAGLAVLAGPSSKLRFLDVRNNQLPSLQAFAVLAGCLSLRELSISGNPACAAPNHRHTLLQALPHVAKLDGASSADVLQLPPDVTSAQHFAAERLQIFDQQVDGQRQPQQQGPPPGGGRTPRMDAGLAAFYQTQQQKGQLGQGHDREGGSGRDSSPYSSQKWPQPQQHGIAGDDWTLQRYHQLQHYPGPGARGENWQQQPGDTSSRRARLGDSSRVHDTYPGSAQGYAPSDYPDVPDSSRRQRVYVADAAVQTAEHLGVQARLEAEANLLRQQVAQLTDELERRNVLEDQVQQELQAALVAAQEQAHKHVEEGYREASQAVATALRELEAARVQGQQAQEQMLHYKTLHEEAKAQCAALQKDMHRLQDDLRTTRDQSGSNTQRAALTLDQERKRAAEAQQALQQQLATEQQRLVAQAAALAAAEQRVAVLDAALQQANAATAAVTSQMAQTVAESNLQAEAVKAKLTAAEQQLAEQQRREMEARAEVSMLMSSLAMQKQSHQQEMELKERAAAEQLAAALDRERAAAEERGKAAVMMCAEKEKGALHEQLTFLKLQLQYALTESEKEAAQLANSVSQGRAEVQELKAALEAAASKSKEQEMLVADLTHVLQKQKAHIQALQQERDGLVRQLRACAPERFERLSAENQALRRANAELDVLREQLMHHKRAWQDAERRIQEAQGGQARAVEEAQSKVAAMEAAVTAAKDEAKEATQKLQTMQQQLSVAEDAVKVKRAMLDSANETIEQLKAELADMQGELEDTRRMAEELDGQLRGGQEQDATEKANLRSEIEAGEAALERMTASVAEAHAKQREAEAKLKTTQEALAEKEAMIHYVNEEVDRVKALFEQREARLRDERDAARRQADLASQEREAAEARSKDARQQLETLRKELEAAQAEVRGFKEAAGRAEAEAAAATQRVTEVEREMQLLLLAVDRQKAASANKMKQLATMLQDL